VRPETIKFLETMNDQNKKNKRREITSVGKAAEKKEPLSMVGGM